jgi:transcriptional regulator with XRE-family HTH domain
MDATRFGLSMRALRRHRRWTQQRLAEDVGVSRTVVARIEQGYGDRVTVRTLIRVAAALGGTVTCRVLWHGEGLDRLLDAAHASPLDRTLSSLRTSGWRTATEVTFNIRGERGSIDILAFHEATGSLLVIEIKSVVPDLQGMLGTLDRKVRVAAEIAKERGWVARTVSRLLVLPDDRTSRRRVDRHRATFETVLPARTVAVRRWLQEPSGGLAGVLFLSDDTDTITRHRVAGQERPASVAPRTNRGKTLGNS